MSAPLHRSDQPIAPACLTPREADCQRIVDEPVALADIEALTNNIRRIRETPDTQVRR